MKLLNSIILALAMLVSMGFAEEPAFCDSYYCPYVTNDEVFREFAAAFNSIQRGDKNCEITSHHTIWEEQAPREPGRDDVVAEMKVLVTCDRYDSRRVPGYINGAARFTLEREKGKNSRVMFYILPITAAMLL